MLGFNPLIAQTTRESEFGTREEDMSSASTEENGSLSPEREVESEEVILQKLQKDVREMRENLRLQRSRNAGPEGVIYHLCICISFFRVANSNWG